MRRQLNPAAVGFLAGIIGSWTMNLLMSAVARAVAGRAEGDPQRNEREIARRVKDFKQHSDPTGRAAEVISITVLKRRLKQREKRIAGPAVHYAFGAIAGAAYALAAESREDVAAGHGTAFGLGLWAAGDEIAVPALRLAPAPWKQPLVNHAAMLGAHVVYGLTVETVRRLMRRAG
jgi:hypothetical protein